MERGTATAVWRLRATGGHRDRDRRHLSPREDGDCDVGEKKQGGPRRQLLPLPEEWGAPLLLLYLLGLRALVHVSHRQLLRQPSAAGPYDFSAPRARGYLDNITAIWPRTVGSPENEVLTVNYLLEQIGAIEKETTDAHKISVDIQRPTGSFSIDFLGGFTSYYANITNVVVKLEPRNGAQHAVLSNCHFDSVPNTPGASDDAVSCAVMLEILNTLSKSSEPLQHAVIFLFNGAEENILQASHGFITQHEWAKSIRAFINLEAAGVGGKELVFQTGPENPWLVQAYVAAAKHPFASVVAQEIFQSGIIPADTDFRIYRDFGNVPGIDLAFIENGYIYHTKYDTSDRILTDSIQRAGATIKFVMIYMLGMFVPYIYMIYLSWTVFEMFTPIMGRSGSEILPDVVLAGFIVVFTVILSSYFINFIYLVKSTKTTLVTLSAVFVVTLILVCSGIFFPYSSDAANPKPKRVFLQHTSRRFHDLTGNLVKSDSGIWINGFDYNGISHITPYVPEINDTIRTPCEEQAPFCGLPWILPVHFMFRKNWYLPAPEIIPRRPIHFKVLSKDQMSSNSMRLSFEVTGPSHMSLYVRPHEGSALSTWSLGDGMPVASLGGDYFVFYSRGLQAAPWRFWVELRVPEKHPSGVVSLAIAAHYFFGEDQKSPQLSALLESFPNWTFSSGWSSTYDLFVF